MSVVVGTAGHIDHGKTTLLRALTGIDADRLPEERRRGMTIDVGYAHLALPDGDVLDFVDVPGHDRLVGNMLVGAGEIDAALVVVAADDGPRAQTHEHLELLDGLGIRDGLAVVTKTDAVDPERVTEVVAATTAVLARTRLAGSPVLAVSAAAGTGLDELRRALAGLRDAVRGRGLPDGPARLAIDRVFAVRGRGTVVTGTLRGGPIEAGATLRLVPGGEARIREVRIREVQVRNDRVERAAGGRAALNLAAVPSDSLRRGDVLTADPAVLATDRLLVALRPSVSLVDARGERVRPPADGARVQVHLGTAAVGATIGRRGREAAELPGGAVTAILRLDRPVAAAVGDRLVLRRPSPGATLAGGRVLDPQPPRGVSRRRATPERLAALAAATDPGDGGTAAPATARGAAAPVTGPKAVEAARLALHGVLPGRPVLVAPDVAEALGRIVVTEVDDTGELAGARARATAKAALRRLASASADLAAAAADGTIDELVRTGRLVRDADRLRDPARAPAAADPRLVAGMDRLERLLDVPTPPPLAEAARAAGCPPDGLRELERSGRIVRLDDDLAWARASYETLVEQALALAADRPLTPAALRDATGSSRKYVMAILEDLDRRAILRRTPEGHVPGHRAARPTGPASR